MVLVVRQEFEPEIGSVDTIAFGKHCYFSSQKKLTMIGAIDFLKWNFLLGCL